MMLAIRGTLWTGQDDELREDHVVLVDDHGVVAAIEPFSIDVAGHARRVVGSPRCWVGPGVYDRHVHLARLRSEQLLAGGVVAVRDMGKPEGPPDSLEADDPDLLVQSVGRVLTSTGQRRERVPTAPEGGMAIDSAERAVAQTVAQHAAGAEAIKIGLHGTGRRRSTQPAVVAATVGAAHERALPVIARAQTVSMVVRALDAGVDELANTPVEPLPASLVRRIKEQGVSVCSTLQMLFSIGLGRDAARNAAALVAEGVPMYYGTDLGNVACRPGVDPRELDRLAAAGLGRFGALRAASIGPLQVGDPARVVLLPDNPIDEPAAWWAPILVVSERYVAGTAVSPAGRGVVDRDVLGGDVVDA